MTPPETRYANSGDVHIAYQVLGSGEFGLVFVPGFVSNLDLLWESPDWAHFFSRLAGFSRLMLFRGARRRDGWTRRNPGVEHRARSRRWAAN